MAAGACGNRGAGAVTADAAAVQDVVVAGDVAAPDTDAQVAGDSTLPDVPDVPDVAVPDVPDAPIPDVPPDLLVADAPVPDTPAPIPDALPWIDTNLTEPSDDCGGDAVYPPDDTTLLLDVGPLLKANVVTGCGKGPPQPVSFGNECCDCPPPYSCYCNGECGWLRGPDLKVPQYGGKAVWTGKWVVSVRVLSQIVSGKWQNTLEGQRWDPSGGGGWESIALPTTPINGSLDVATAAGKVYVKTRDKAMAGIRLVYDPDTDLVKKWTAYSTGQNPHMAEAGGKIVEVGPAGKDDYLTGGLWLYDPGTESWTMAPFPSALLPVDGYLPLDLVLGDANSAYLYDCAFSDTSSPFPDGTFASDVGHILKFDLATSTWTDIGLAPKDWRYDVVQSANVRPDGTLLVGKNFPTAEMQFAKLANGKWQFGPVVQFWQSTIRLRSVDLPCGVAIGSAHVQFGPGQNDFFYHAAVVRDDLTPKLIPAWGMPAGAGTGLAHTQLVAIPGHVLLIGGEDGGAHRATYRYPISKLCK